MDAYIAPLSIHIVIPSLELLLNSYIAAGDLYRNIFRGEIHSQFVQQ